MAIDVDAIDADGGVLSRHARRQDTLSRAAGLFD